MNIMCIIFGALYVVFAGGILWRFCEDFAPCWQVFLWFSLRSCHWGMYGIEFMRSGMFDFVMVCSFRFFMSARVGMLFCVCV